MCVLTRAGLTVKQRKRRHSLFSRDSDKEWVPRSKTKDLVSVKCLSAERGWLLAIMDYQENHLAFLLAVRHSNVGLSSLAINRSFCGICVFDTASMVSDFGFHQSTSPSSIAQTCEQFCLMETLICLPTSCPVSSGGKRSEVHWPLANKGRPAEGKRQTWCQVDR